MTRQSQAALWQEGLNVLLRVRVHPCAPRERYLYKPNDALHIDVTKKPEGGRVNQRVCQLLASLLDLPEKSIRIVQGTSSRKKTILIKNTQASHVHTALIPKQVGEEV